MANAQRKNPDIQPTTRPDLRSIAGGGETTDERAKLRALESSPSGVSTGSVAEQEESPSNVIQGPWNTNVSGQDEQTSFDKVNFLKGKGPIAGVVGTIIAIVLGILGIAGPGLGIVSFAQTLTDALNDAEPALSIRTTKMLARKADGLKNGFSESGNGKCNIRCKFGTVSDTMLRNLKANGFDVQTSPDKVGGRYVMTSMTFPGKEPRVTVTDGASYTKALKDPALASKFYRVYSGGSYFLNSRFGTTLRQAFGLDKLAKFSGASKEKVIESWRKSMGLQGPSAAEDPTKALSDLEKAKAGRFKPAFDVLGSAQAKFAAKGANVIGGACTIYNTGRGVTFAVKAAKYATYAAVAFSIINLAHQIRAGDSPSGEAISLAGDQLTQIDLNELNPDGTENAFYGLSAFDSNGFKMAEYQDNPGVLSAQEQAYGVSPVGPLAIIIGAATSLIVGAGEPAIAVAHGLCSVAANPALGVAAGCGEQIVTALLTAVETLGVGALVSAAWCAAKVIAIGVGASLVLGALINEGTNMIVKGELPVVDETTRGAPIGDMSYNGSAGIYAAAASDVGMMTGSVAEIKQFAVDTADIRAQNAAIASYNARDTPLDAYNQYSFLGSMLSKMGVASISRTSLVSGFGDIASIIPKSFASLSTAANAAGSVAIADNKSQLFSNNGDVNLAAIGAASDSMGNASYVMSGSELEADGGTVAQWMIDNGQINEDSGKPKSGTVFKKFVDYCTSAYFSKGFIPPGETPAAIEEDDYDWKSGLRCRDKSEAMSNYRTFTMDIAINDFFDTKPGAKQKKESVEVTTPAVEGFSITSGFGPRASPCEGCSSWHVGLDFINSGDSTVRAMADGEVIQTDGSGANNVVRIKHADGLISEYWHMYTQDIIVKKGDVVAGGQKLGVMGNSGNSRGTHLHFVLDISEVEDPSVYEDLTKNTGGFAPVGSRINPAQYLKSHGLSGFDDEV